MTARRIAMPVRHAGNPQGDVEAARAKVDNLRRAVAERRAGASALALAEYELHRALGRLDGPPAA